MAHDPRSADLHHLDLVALGDHLAAHCTCHRLGAEDEPPCEACLLRAALTRARAALIAWEVARDRLRSERDDAVGNAHSYVKRTARMSLACAWCHPLSEPR
jgi:hypothetical protein